jgi:hypothetical protein
MKSIIFLRSASLILLVLTVSKAQTNDPGQRMTPAEIDGLKPTAAGPGTSGLSGIQTRLLKGDPNKAGLYTIQLSIPATQKLKLTRTRMIASQPLFRERGTSATAIAMRRANSKPLLPAAFTPNRPAWRTSPAPEIDLWFYRSQALGRQVPSIPNRNEK